MRQRGVSRFQAANVQVMRLKSHEMSGDFRKNVVVDCESNEMSTGEKGRGRWGFTSGRFTESEVFHFLLCCTLHPFAYTVEDKLPLTEKAKRLVCEIKRLQVFQVQEQKLGDYISANSIMAIRSSSVSNVQGLKRFSVA